MVAFCDVPTGGSSLLSAGACDPRVPPPRTSPPSRSETRDPPLPHPPCSRAQRAHGGVEGGGRARDAALHRGCIVSFLRKFVVHPARPH